MSTMNAPGNERSQPPNCTVCGQPAWVAFDEAREVMTWQHIVADGTHDADVEDDLTDKQVALARAVTLMATYLTIGGPADGADQAALPDHGDGAGR